MPGNLIRILLTSALLAMTSLPLWGQAPPKPVAAFLIINGCAPYCSR